MDVDALSGSKGQNNMSSLVCLNCGKSCHYEWTQDKGWSGDKGNSKSKESNGKSKGKEGKGKGNCKLNIVESWQEGWSETGAQGDEHADGWTWSGELKDGGKRQMIRMDRVQYSG